MVSATVFRSRRKKYFGRLAQRQLLFAMLVTAPAAVRAQAVDYADLAETFGEPVTTSVTGKPQQASEAPATLIIITRDDIRRSPARDVPGLIQAYSGIDVTRWTAGQSDVAIRGGVRPMNPSLLVLVNGRQVYLDHYGMTNWAGLGVQLNEIQQIEVVKGPNSALFGFNAASGVINIITIGVGDEPSLSISAGLGTKGLREVSGVARLPLGQGVGLRLSGGYGTEDELHGLDRSVLASRLTPAFDPRHQEAAAELYASLVEGTDASIGITRSSNRQLGNSPVLFTVPGRYDFTSIGGQLSHDTGWGAVNARFFRNCSKIDASSESGTLVFHNEVFAAATELLVRAGSRNILRGGLEYRTNRLEIVPGYPGATRYRIYAASGMWESQLASSVTWTLAGRVDHLALSQVGPVDQPTLYSKADYDRAFTEWSLNGALRISLSELDTLLASASRGIQAPSLFSLGSRLTFPNEGLPLPLVISGDPYLKAARTFSAELGWNHLFQSGSRVSLTTFYNRTTDVLSDSVLASPPRAAPPQYPFVLYSSANVGSFKAFGLEAEASGRLASGWTWIANYTWTHSNQNIADNTAAMLRWPLAVDRATPEHKVKAQVSYERGPWLATLAGRYTSATRQAVVADTPESPISLVRVRGGLALDAKVAVRLNEHLSASVVGENLTDLASANLSPAPADRRLRAGLQLDF